MSGGEPRQQALVKFCRSCAYGSTVVGVRDVPENYILVAGLNAARVARRNVAVDLAVNQKNRNLRSCDRIFWRDLLHVEVVLETDVEESKLDDRSKERTSEPGAEVKGLSHAVVGDLAKAGKARFGSDGAEARLDGERLQEFGRAHGFPESEDAVRVALRQEVEPLMNVIAFEKTVGGELAAACAVSTRVGEKNGESVGKEESRISSRT